MNTNFGGKTLGGILVPPAALVPGATTADVADCYVVLAKRKFSHQAIF